MAEVQTDVQGLHNQVKTAYQITVEIKPRIPQIITAISLLLTFQLLWSILAHVAVIYLAWLYLKVGRLDFHRVISE